MKKIFAVLLAGVMLALSFASCGKQSFNYMEEDLSAYVSIGEYKDLTVTIPTVAEVTDEEVKNHAVSHLSHAEDAETVEGGVAEDGSLVSIDFIGTMDGEEFEGGSGENTGLLIGSGTMIDGFEASIIGMTVGETKTIDVTFPEDYDAEELAGKPAQFEITLKKVYADTFFDSVREELEENREVTIESNKNKYAWTAVINNATVNAYPEAAVKSLANDLYEYYQAAYYQYIQYGLTLENLGITEETCLESAKDTFKEEMVLYSIVKAGGYSVTEEEFNAKVEALAEAQEVSAAQYLSVYSRQSVETKIYYEKVMADVLASATFVEE